MILDKGFVSFLDHFKEQTFCFIDFLYGFSILYFTDFNSPIYDFLHFAYIKFSLLFVSNGLTWKVKTFIRSFFLNLFVYGHLIVKVSRSVVSDSLWSHEQYSLPSPSIHGILQARVLEWATAMNFLLGTAFSVLQKFWYVVVFFSFTSKYLVMSCTISYLIHWLFTNMLFNCHIIVNFPNFFLSMTLKNFNPFKFIEAGLMTCIMVYPGECSTCSWEVCIFYHRW